MRLRSAVALIGILLVGCVSAPEIRRPEIDVEVPGEWTAAPTIPGEISDEWWRDFDDPGLDAAIRAALERNFDLRAAASRVERAMADARIAGADIYPTLDAGLGRSRQRRNFIGFPFPGAEEEEVLSTTFTNYGVSLDVSWEIDLWGRVRAGTQAALADLQASEADLAGAALSIAGQTAKAWFTAVEASQQLDLAEETRNSFRASYDHVRARYEAGIRSPLDIRLAKSNLEDALALVERRRQQLDGAVRQLEVLLGRYPGKKASVPDELCQVVPEIPAGLPGELVSRRPDLAAAERRLAAADARLRSARRALYPRFSLTASGGTATEEFEDLLDRDFRVWTLILNLTQPIFEGGRLRAGVAQTDAAAAEALADYAAQVLNAYAEVESSLAAEGFLAGRVTHLACAAEQATAATRLAEDRYRSGLEDYVTVLESQRRALTNESNLIAVQRERLENRIDLYLALGGGFEVKDERDAANAAEPHPTEEETGS